MKALTLTDEQARSFYPTASAGLKAALETSWGADFFKQKVTDRIKTVADACKALGKDYTQLERHCATLRPETAAFERMLVVIEALNEGWVPDFDDDDEEKWYIVWDMEVTTSNPSGFGFYCALYAYTVSNVGSRLSFKSEELARYAGTQFVDVFKPFFKR